MISYSVCAGDFSVTPLDDSLDLSKLDNGIRIKKSTPGLKRYLTPAQRDEILSKHLGKELKSFDTSERDLLYKSLINYDDKTLLSKYPLLKNTNLKRLKDDLL